MVVDPAEVESAFFRLYEIVRILRSEQGCPWDKNQTPLAMRRSLIEECFEAVDAITSDDSTHVCEELGDVLFNVLMIAYMYEEAGDFSLSQSLQDISDKLVRRHPHVFPQGEVTSDSEAAARTKAHTTEQVIAQWDSIKENMEGRKGASVFDSVPQGFPPLLRAYKLLKKAAKKGLVTHDRNASRATLSDALKTVDDAALSVAATKSTSSSEPFTVRDSSSALDKAQLDLEEKVGDALFALVDYARLLGVDPVVALDRANRTFCYRACS